jgi:hypothetical protein
MKFLCLICAEKMMEHTPEADAERHFEEYREFTEATRKSGHFIGATGSSPPVPRPRSGCGKARFRSPTARTRKPRSSLAAITSSRPRIFRKRSRWPRGSRGPGSGASRYDRSRRTHRRSARSDWSRQTPHAKWRPPVSNSSSPVRLCSEDHRVSGSPETSRSRKCK